MRPFFLLIHPKGKKKTQKPQGHKNKQGKQRATKAKPLKIGKERKTKANKGIN